MSSVADARLVPDWSGAACLEEDPELFFPIGNGAPFVPQIEAAKAVCGRCPFTADCLEWAMAPGGPEYGVFGGLDEEERRAARRRGAKRFVARRAYLRAAAERGSEAAA